MQWIHYGYNLDQIIITPTVFEGNLIAHFFVKYFNICVLTIL